MEGRTKIKVEGYFNPAPASIDGGGYDGRGVERRRLTIKMHSISKRKTWK